MVHTPGVVSLLLASPPGADQARVTTMHFCRHWNATERVRLAPRQLEIPSLIWCDGPDGASPYALPEVELGLVVLAGGLGRTRPAAWSRTADLLRRLQRRGVTLQVVVAPGLLPGGPGGVPSSFLDQLGGRIPVTVAGAGDELRALLSQLVVQHLQAVGEVPDGHGPQPTLVDPRPGQASRGHLVPAGASWDEMAHPVVGRVAGEPIGVPRRAVAGDATTPAPPHAPRRAHGPRRVLDDRLDLVALVQPPRRARA